MTSVPGVVVKPFVREDTTTGSGMTVGTIYSGIGGADCGFMSSGWQVAWQVEADSYRRAVLRKHFRVGATYEDAFDLPSDLPHADTIYAELPDWRIDRWWPPVMAAVQRVRPTFVVCEYSPTVRFERIVRDLALDGWAFRLLFIAYELQMDGVPEQVWDRRKRSLIIASKDPAAIDRLGVGGNTVDVTVSNIKTDHTPKSMEWYEVSRGFQAGWGCICEADTCCCGEQRFVALNEATSPALTQWLACLLDGSWTDGVVRGVTAADGTKA